MGLLGLLAVLFTPNTSFGSLITYNFTGVIRETLQETTTIVGGQPVTTTSPLASVGAISAGDLFFGTFQFETNDAAPDGFGIGPDPGGNEGFYSLSGSLVSSMTVTIDGLTFSAGPGYVATRNNVNVPVLSPSSDVLAVVSDSVSGFPAGWNSVGTSIATAFADGSGTVFTNDALPTSFTPGDFNLGELSLSFFQTVNFPGGSLPSTVRIYGNINLEAVPEPSSMILVSVAGGLGLVLRRRRLHRPTPGQETT